MKRGIDRIEGESVIRASYIKTETPTCSKPTLSNGGLMGWGDIPLTF